jgi:hypothetical protein
MIVGRVMNTIQRKSFLAQNLNENSTCFNLGVFWLGDGRKHFSGDDMLNTILHVKEK